MQALADWVGIGGFGPLLVGSPETVADELQSWVEETDVDGFNLAYAVTHESFTDVVELLIPELQKRGVYKKDYQPGTLRENCSAQARVWRLRIRRVATVALLTAKSRSAARWRHD
ncbi:Pristinamycin IIA synthase subunit A [Ewingella americana]|uniref:Pristinamycin IIA synthase subunit A n=1 Tax=Ewingella americana TaxID=41202 RepID=A0A377NGQ2_9GAMM|nr:Pristinamycin IIA synthase subunit A [Ewingella americana]